MCSEIRTHENGNGWHKSWKHGEHRSFEGRLVEVTLPNGRHFSFSLGHMILLGLLIWWLPFNWLVLFGVLWLAYQFGSSNRDGQEKPKVKRKTDEQDEFEVFKA